MEYLFLGLGWLICGAVGFWFAQDDWRREHNFDVQDAAFFGSMALLAGPLFLVIAIGFWLVFWFAAGSRGKTVIWERKQ